MKMDVSAFVGYLEDANRLICENRDYVTRLDAETGDGDHWANMNMGFSKLLSKKESLAAMSLPDLFRECGMTMMSGVGGSAGVLYGSPYHALSKAFAGRDCIDEGGVVLYLETQAEAIMKRGRVEPGNKTMLDPLYQAKLSVEEALKRGVHGAALLEALKAGADQGMRATAGMPAFKGRACYRPDKGVGHLDPGAVTMEYQLRAFADKMLEGEPA